MKYRFIDLDDAPTKARLGSRSRQMATEIIRLLEPGKAAVVTPEPPDTVRGTKSTLTRAGTREGRPVRVWAVDGKIYVALSGKDA